MAAKFTKFPGGVEIAGWTIKTVKAAMNNSAELKQFVRDLAYSVILMGSFLESERDTAQWEDILDLPSLPEMVFGKNKMSFTNQAAGFVLEFDTLDAMKLVKHENPDIKVSAHKVWTQSNQDQVEALSPNSENQRHFQYDWTFTSRYIGTLKSEKEGHSFKVIEKSGASIPLETLKRPDPIIQYDEVHLYEDELADSGIAEMCVKTRVMPTYFFVLLRFWLRVDDVMFRIFDTRFFHAYGTNEIIREWTVREGKWENIQPLVKDVKSLGDPNIISPLLTQTENSVDTIVFS